MNLNEIVHILKKDFQPRITVFGDFCLDKYLYVDGERDELSLETNLTAYQISHKKLFAGAGGTITNNLLALGARVDCIGIVGNDGEGYELLKCLKNAGADVSLMIQTDERHTGTYIKPMSYIKDETREMNRLDIKNFTSTPRHLEKQLIENLQKILANTNAVIICDQYTEVDCGAVTNFVQKSLSNLAYQYKDKIWYVDSRSNIDKFKNTIVKCNNKETAQAFNVTHSSVNSDTALNYCKALYESNGKPVYITLGKDGSVVFDGKGHKIPAFPVTGHVDVVGAGDACNAGIVFALVKGANYEQAGFVGNAAASIVIKKIGETGVAKLDEIISLLSRQTDI